MTEVSNARLWALRGAYLLVAVGLLLVIWPSIVSHPSDWPHMRGVVSCMLGALSVLALFGLRYPLQMLPVLLFDILWKLIWLLAVAVPLWITGEMDEQRMTTVTDTIPAIILVIAIPWRYVIAKYLRQPAEVGGLKRSAAPAFAD